jgi:hypothetical protein
LSSADLFNQIVRTIGVRWSGPKLFLQTSCWTAAAFCSLASVSASGFRECSMWGRRRQHSSIFDCGSLFFISLTPCPSKAMLQTRKQLGLGDHQHEVFYAARKLSFLAVPRERLRAQGSSCRFAPPGGTVTSTSRAQEELCHSSRLSRGLKHRCEWQYPI